jgi:hypothetical protein
LFFGWKDKDTIPPRFLLDRINKAATITNWNMDEQKITKFYLTLRQSHLVMGHAQGQPSHRQELLG